LVLFLLKSAIYDTSIGFSAYFAVFCPYAIEDNTLEQDMSQDLLSPKEAAARMSLSVRRVRQLIAAHELRHVRIFNRNLVPAEAITEFFERNTVAPKSEDSADVSKY
jgi:excisionase family DNA binding protein